MLHGVWNLPEPGIEPMSPALADGFLSTAPPGSLVFHFKYNSVHMSIQDSLTILPPLEWVPSFIILMQSSVTQSCPTLCDPVDYSPPGSSVHGDSPGKNTGVACGALLQGIFPTQGSNPGLPHCRQSLYCLSHREALMQVYYQKQNPLCLLGLRICIPPEVMGR